VSVDGVFQCNRHSEVGQTGQYKRVLSVLIGANPTDEPITSGLPSPRALQAPNLKHRIARIRKTQTRLSRLKNANVATTKVIKLAEVRWLAAYDVKRRTRSPTAYRPRCSVF
jgi:hypothetical protein